MCADLTETENHLPDLTAFITHSILDEDTAYQLRSDLLDRGLRVSMPRDFVTLDRGMDAYMSSLRKSISETDIYFVLVAETSESSGRLEREIAFAASLADESLRRIVPVLTTRDAKLPLHLQHMLSIEYYDRKKAALQIDALINSVTAKNNDEKLRGMVRYADTAIMNAMINYALYEKLGEKRYSVEDQLTKAIESRDTDTVIVLVHGIRTYAYWEPMVRHIFEEAGLTVEATNYGYFDIIRFLLPIATFRRAPVERIWRSVQRTQQLHPNAKICFLAHSFGTWIIAKILQREFAFKAHRVIFCGSIIPFDFPFEQFGDRFTSPLLNEVGSRDPWPALAESGTWGYGSSGTYGFRIPGVRDRWHGGFGHSHFFTADFCKQFWLPFFLDGTVVRSNTDAEAPRWWVRLISRSKLKYSIPLISAALFLLFRVTG
jgi:hypothetical protein